MITAATKYYLVCIAVLLCTVAACSKKEPGSTPISADVEKYFSYKPGTYWIYQDSLSGQIDSFVVTSSGTTSMQNNTYSYDQETIVVSVYNNSNFSFNCYWNFKENLMAFVYGNVSYDLLDVEFPFQPIGNIISPTYDSASIVNNYSNYIVNAFSYNNVTEIYELYRGASVSENSEDLFFINNDIGIIKMNLNHPSYLIRVIWELQRYKIVH